MGQLRRSLTSLGASVLILLLGGALIRGKLQEAPSIHEDLVLTPDEIRNLPSDRLVAVLDRKAINEADSLPFRMLRLSLEKNGAPFALGYSAAPTDQEAAIQRIAASIEPSRANPSGITVVVFGSGGEIDRRLRAIPIPVDGGLLGLRASWVNANRMERFHNVRSREELRQAVAIQGVGWSDAGILRAARLRVYTVEPSRILDLVDQDRVDFYPRGITELEDQRQRVENDYDDIALDPHLLLAYPFAQFFYVNPANQRLQAAIERGLRRAEADGSYQALIQRQLFTPWLKRSLNLPRRTLLTLPNPEGTSLLQRVDPRFWMVPWKELEAGRIVNGAQLCGLETLRPLCP